MVAYALPRASRSVWVPTSTSRPSCITAIKFAVRTVENRCETMPVVVPWIVSFRATRENQS
jgi:hypothetical protein